jgi:hypothetical protein
MTGYDIFLSDGELLTTINVKTIDQQNNSSLVLIGQGIPNYGAEIAQNFVWLLENFSKSAAPVNPLIGQEWYDTTNDRMNVYNGNEWRYYTTAEISYSMFDMAPAATNVNFATIGTVSIFTGSNANKKYCPIHLVMLPRGAFTATSFPTFNLSVDSDGDVLSSTALTNITSTEFVKIDTNQHPVLISGTETLNLNITVAATGGQLNFDVYVFGVTI